VLFEAEDVCLFLLSVPVAADAFEDSRAVMDAMGHNSQLGLFQRYYLVFKVSVRGHGGISFLITIIILVIKGELQEGKGNSMIYSQ
jgi:hypothetical protein